VAHYAANRDAERARSRANYAAHADARRAAKKKADSDPESKARKAAYNKAYYAANANAIRAYNKAYYAANANAIRANERVTGPARHLKFTYGLTVDEYEQMLQDQGGLCANPGCFNAPSGDKRRFPVDHDHRCCPGVKSCGKCVRGILCNPCNAALGHVRDDLKRLQGLIDYLEGYGA
jgi:hypothetical protein